MATIDISLINAVSPVIVFLLLFIGGWGILRMVNPFKKAGESLYGILAFLIALIMVMNRTSVAVIMTATPWLIVVSMLAFFFIFFAMMFGASAKDITIEAGKNKGWIIFFVMLIFVFSIGAAFGPGLLASQPTSTSGTTITADNTSAATSQGAYVVDGQNVGTATNDFGTNLVFTIFNPKIIGMLFLFILGTLTILLLSK